MVGMVVRIRTKNEEEAKMLADEMMDGVRVFFPTFIEDTDLTIRKVEVLPDGFYVGKSLLALKCPECGNDIVISTDPFMYTISQCERCGARLQIFLVVKALEGARR